MKSESSGRRMASTIRNDLLPNATAASAELLLSAVLSFLPVPASAKRFARNQDFESLDRAWLLEVLPDCLDRLLHLLPPTVQRYPEVCVEAAERLEALHHLSFLDGDDFLRVCAAVRKHTALRWLIALEIAQSADLSRSVWRLTSAMTCVVNFAAADADALVEKANDASVEESVRNIWFALACDIAIRTLKGRNRGRVLTTLCQGTEAVARREKVEAEWRRRCNDLKLRRKWNSEKFAQKRGEAEALERDRQQLVSDILGISSGTSRTRLEWLVHFSYECSDRRFFSHVEYEVIAAHFGHEIAGALRQGLLGLFETTEPPDPSEHRDGTTPWAVILALAGCGARFRDCGNPEKLTPLFVAGAARLAVWENSAVPHWFHTLAESHPAIVEESLRPWLEADAKNAGGSSLIRRALQLALRSTPSVRRTLLAPLKPLIANDAIPNAEVFRSLLKAMRADDLLNDDEVCAAYIAKVDASTLEDGSIPEMTWLRAWLGAQAASALGWVSDHAKRYPSVAHQNAVMLARAAADFKSMNSFEGEFKWMTIPCSDGDVSVLDALDRLLPRYPPDEDHKVIGRILNMSGEQVVGVVRRTVFATLVRTPGIVAHRTLIVLVNRETYAGARPVIEAQVVEHASREAALATYSPADIKRLAIPFTFEPKNEAELLVQVMGRLKEIKLRTEQGPFSDRALFSLEISEAALQNWLAARLWEHPNRKYSVAREEQVDNDKMPDIQAAVAAGKVCIEIKPLSRKHSYSAVSLVETLRTQIGEQYLRGLNSRHGVLVLFRLDDKKWKIPGVSGLGSYEDLAAYLQRQADQLRESVGHIDALQVLLIDCVPPAKR
jgi:hypothetical protein